MYSLGISLKEREHKCCPVATLAWSEVRRREAQNPFKCPGTIVVNRLQDLLLKVVGAPGWKCRTCANNSEQVPFVTDSLGNESFLAKGTIGSTVRAQERARVVAEAIQVEPRNVMIAA